MSGSTRGREVTPAARGNGPVIVLLVAVIAAIFGVGWWAFFSVRAPATSPPAPAAPTPSATEIPSATPTPTPPETADR